MSAITWTAREAASIDAAVAFAQRVLPGWSWRVATCCVSDDAWIFPDFNDPVHGTRLLATLSSDIDWAELTDIDLRPAGRPALALCMAVQRALDLIPEYSVGGAA
ncbi:hypothetical protein ACCT18_01295 [Rhizobium ruizarguesonis]